MKLALEIIKREIAQRELANKHNHLRKDEITKELESLQKAVNFISSNPMLADSCQHNWLKSHSKHMLYCGNCGKYKPEGS